MGQDVNSILMNNFNDQLNNFFMLKIKIIENNWL